jgi:hypothetical protein
VVSNGLLLPQKSKQVINSLKNFCTKIFITKHFDDPEYNAKFDLTIRFLNENNISFDVSHSYLQWIKMYRIVDEHPQPYNSDPQIAYKNCFFKNSCFSIRDNKLYKCGQLASICRLASDEKIPSAWKHSLTHEPLTEYATKNDILKYFSSGAMPECSLCPEKYEFISTSEVSSKFHRTCEKKKRKAS